MMRAETHTFAVAFAFMGNDVIVPLPENIHCEYVSFGKAMTIPPLSVVQSNHRLLSVFALLLPPAVSVL